MNQRTLTSLGSAIATALLLTMAVSSAWAVTISGRVLLDGDPNQPVSGVTMEGLPGSPFTDDHGFYSATVGGGLSWTVTPTEINFVFTPGSRYYPFLLTDQLNQDYVAQQAFFSIFGDVRTAGGVGIAGVAMEGFPATTTTDANGHYQSLVLRNFTGTVTPTKSGYSFDPQSTSLANVTENIGPRDFVGTLIPTGACCVGETCSVLTEAACTAQSGVYQGDDVACGSSTCSSATPTGACCTGEVCAVMAAAACTAQSGTYKGDGTGCGPSPCTQAQPATGACCVGQTCSVLTAAACAAQSGTYQGDSVACGSSTCSSATPTGACCVGENCQVVAEAACTAQSGIYQGNNVACGSSTCSSTTPAAPAARASNARS